MNGMDLMTLESAEERKNLDEMHSNDLGHLWNHGRFHIGGVLEMRGDYTSWHWLPTGKPITIPLEFPPGEPNNSGQNQPCLAILFTNYGQENIEFDDVECSNNHETSFICEQRQVIGSETKADE